MRLTVLAGLALTTSVLSACTSASTKDVLTIRPSAEVVSSISPPAPQTDINALINSEAQNPYPEPLANQAAIVAAPPPMAQPKPVEVAAIKPANPAPRASSSRGKVKVYRQRFGDAKPINFGHAADPKRFQVHGVDVSHWQAKIDWKKLRTRGANFAFIKATEGGKHADRLFKHNWKATKAAGIPRGAYHFMYWCRNAEEQAKWFIRHVPREKGALPPVLDVEWNGNKRTCPHKISKKRVLAKMKVWLDIIERHYGQRPIIYTAPDFYEDNLKGQFKRHSFWLRSVAAHPKKRYPNRDFAFWQYSGTGLSKGVSTQIDLNVFNGTEEGWQRWLKKAMR